MYIVIHTELVSLCALDSLLQIIIIINHKNSVLVVIIGYKYSLKWGSPNFNILYSLRGNRLMI